MDRSKNASDKIVKYIDWHWEQLGCAPSYREIGQACGLQSTSTVQVYLKNLERQGRITIGARGKNVRTVNDGDPRFCKHDWRVRKIANPMPLICADCKLETEVEYDPEGESEIVALLKYTGKVR